MSCLLCRSENLRKVINHTAGHSLWRCRKCGLLQTVPMPSSEEISAYYQRYDVLGEKEPYYREAWGPNALSSSEGLEIIERFKWSQKFCGRFGRVLDVGSGPGIFLRLVKSAGGEPHGIELNARAAERSAKELGVPVVSGTLADSAGKFDQITLWDLLEHVSDPVALIRQCAERLEVGGWLFVETPNESALLDRFVLLLSGLGITGPAKTFYGLHHLVLFRNGTVSRLLRENGFEVVKIAGAETPPARVFRGKGFSDKIVRLGLNVIFAVARIMNRRNKMLIAAKKK